MPKVKPRQRGAGIVYGHDGEVLEGEVISRPLGRPYSVLTQSDVDKFTAARDRGREDGDRLPVRLNYFDTFQNKQGDPVQITFRVFVPSNSDLTSGATAVALQALDHQLKKLEYDSHFELRDENSREPNLEIRVDGIKDKKAYVQLVKAIKGCVPDVSEALFQDRRLKTAKFFEEEVADKIDEKVKALDPDRPR